MTSLQTLDCSRCGACCEHVGTPPFVPLQGYADWDQIPGELQIEVELAIQSGRGEKEMPCIWLDGPTKRCNHYEHRPDACRNFELGGSYCLRFRSERGIA